MLHELDLSAGPAQRERVEHEGGAHVLCELPLGWQHLLRAKRPEDMDLKYGLNLLFTDKGIRPDEMARAMEDAGYESLWIGDHSHIPVSLKSSKALWWDITDAYWHNLDEFVALTMAATATTRLKIATGLCLVIERDPITTAKTTATLDLISDGRFIFGVGAGWNAEEMAHHGTSFSSRWRLLRERVEAIRNIWTEEEPEYHGKFVHFGPMWSYPKPVQQPHPPIIVGGNGPQALELTIALEANWTPMFFMRDWPDIREKIGILRRMPPDVGRDPSTVHVIPFPIDPPGPQVIEEMNGLGVEHIVIDVHESLDRDGVLRAIEEHAKLID